MKRLFVIVLMIFSIVLVSPMDAFADNKVNRISGDTRSETAVNISQEGWKKGADTVVIATGRDFADALSSSTLAYALNAPILLASSPNQLAEATIKELERLNPKRIIIIGGEKVINESLKQNLKTSGYTVDRIAGDNRFETSVEVAEEVLKLNPQQKQIIVAKGLDFPDALSSAAYAAKAGIPIILTIDNRLPEPVKAFINKNKINKSIVVGGDKAILPSVIKDLPNAERVFGKDRYLTATALATYFKADLEHIYLATGHDFPDALTGSILAAKNNAPILLTPKIRLLDSIKPVVQQATTATIFGGKTAVEDTVLNQIVKELKVVKVVEETVMLDFETIEKEDPKLDKGVTKVSQEGAKGQEVITTKVTYRNGKEVSREVVSRKIVKEPVHKIVLIGTRDVITKEQTTEEIEINYETIEEDDPSLDKGKTKVKQAGKKGHATDYYELTYINGELSETVFIERVINSEPVDEIILVGTKDVITEEEVTEEEAIPFNVDFSLDDDLFKDERVVDVEGKDGLLVTVYKVIYSNGEEMVREIISETVEAEPVTEVVRVGTKSRDDGQDTIFKPDFEDELLSMVNEERLKCDLEPLEKSPEASTIARDYSEYMLLTGDYRHNPYYAIQLMEAGIQFYRAGENIAVGYETPKSVFDAWMNSPGHRANILHPDFTHMGNGYANNELTNRPYWTQVFYGTFNWGPPNLGSCN